MNLTVDGSSSGQGFLVFEVFVHLLLSLTGTLGNTFVIFAVIVTSKLRTVPNAYVTTLAVLNLVQSAILEPLRVVDTIRGEWVSGAGVQFCRMQAFTLIWFHVASLIILGLIAFNRFLNITKSMQTYRRYSAPHHFVLQVGGAFILAGIPVLLPLLGVGKVDFVGFNPVLGHCSFRYGIDGVVIYTKALFAFGLLIGTVVIPFNYIMIWRHVRQSRSRVSAWSEVPSPKHLSSPGSTRIGNGPTRPVPTIIVTEIPGSHTQSSIPFPPFHDDPLVPSRPNLHHVRRDNSRVSKLPARHISTIVGTRSSAMRVPQTVAFSPMFSRVVPSRRSLHRDNLRLTRNLWLLSLTYLVSFTPFCFLVFFDGNFSLPVWLWRTVDIFLWSASAINPYLYAWMTSSFRSAFKKLHFERNST